MINPEILSSGVDNESESTSTILNEIRRLFRIARSGSGDRKSYLDFIEFFEKLNEEDRETLKDDFESMRMVLDEKEKEDNNRLKFEGIKMILSLRSHFDKIRQIEGKDLSDEEVFNMIMELSEEEFNGTNFYPEFVEARNILNKIKSSCNF